MKNKVVYIHKSQLMRVISTKNKEHGTELLNSYHLLEPLVDWDSEEISGDNMIIDDDRKDIGMLFE